MCVLCDEHIMCVVGIAGWRASFILTSAQSAFALVMWYYFSVSHVIPALNTPAPHASWMRDSAAPVILNDVENNVPFEGNHSSGGGERGGDVEITPSESGMYVW